MENFNNIRKWARERNLIMGSDPKSQMLKLTEEVGEISAAIARKNNPAIADGIGDVVVVLTILASQFSLNIEDCIEGAWQEIKDRKGKMVDGIFVKGTQKFDEERMDIIGPNGNDGLHYQDDAQEMARIELDNMVLRDD